MNIRYLLLQISLMVFNLAAVLLAAHALGFDIFVNRQRFIIFAAIAFAPLMAENIIWDKIHSKA